MVFWSPQLNFGWKTQFSCTKWNTYEDDFHSFENIFDDECPMIASLFFTMIDFKWCMSFDDVKSLSFEKFSIKNVYIQIKDENSTLQRMDLTGVTKD